MPIVNPMSVPVITQEPFNLGDVILKAIQAKLTENNARLQAAQAQKQELINPYAADMEKENLRNLILQNKYYEPNIQSEISSRQANSAYTNAQRQQLMQQIENPGYGAGGLPGEIGLYSYFAKHPELINKMSSAGGINFNPLKAISDSINADIQNTYSLAKNRGASSQNKGVDLGLQIGLRDQIKKDFNVDDNTANDIANSWQSGENTLSDGSYAPKPTGSAISILNSINKRAKTSQQLNQERFASTLENLFSIADENSDEAFKYSGIAGKMKGGINSLVSQTGENDPGYISYRKFVDQDVPAIVTEIVRTSGANSTDAQKAMAIQQTLPIDMVTSPNLAKAKWQELKKLYRSVGKTISKTPYELSQSNREAANKNTSSSNNATIKIIRGKDGKLMESQ